MKIDIILDAGLPAEEVEELGQLADRYGIKDRLVISGMAELPWGFRISGIAEYRSGTPWSPFDGDAEYVACGEFKLGFGGCNPPLPVVGGRIIPRNSRRSESIERIDLRLSKLFEFGERYQIELFAEGFNILDEHSFAVGGDQQDVTGDEFGIPDNLVTNPRQYQFGARFRF